MVNNLINDISLNIVTFEQAIALKELGFGPDENNAYDKDGQLINFFFYQSLSDYNKDIYAYAPSLELATKFLRDKKRINICPQYWRSESHNTEWWSCEINNKVRVGENEDNGGCYQSFEEALSAGINYVLNKLKYGENI